MKIMQSCISDDNINKKNKDSMWTHPSRVTTVVIHGFYEPDVIIMLTRGSLLIFFLSLIF